MYTGGTDKLSIGLSAINIVGMSSAITAGTKDLGTPASSEGLYFIPGQMSWDDAWELKSALLVQVRTSREEVLASTYLTVQEIGVGPSLESAVYDLLTSLSEYYQSLESHENRLGPPGKEDLARLRNLIGAK